MIGRNIRFLALVVIGCISCAVQANRMRDVNDIALAMDLVEQLYVKPVQRAELSRLALTGMMQGLDNYSGYIPPQDLAEFRAQIEQSFAGLGVVITKKEGAPLRIVRLIHDSPAEKSGLQVGEFIVEINGQATEPMSTDDATALLRGSPESDVLLTVKERESAATRPVRVVRAMIETPSVIGDRRDASGKPVYRMQANSDIAYVHMSVFGAQSTKEMERFLKSEAIGAKAVIWDLRDNSGGLLDTARDLCDMFLDEELILTTEGRVAEVFDEIRSTDGVILPKDVPLIVLIDRGSASASEVTAACLQDLGRAKIAGERSFGKGSVQNIIDMDGGRSRLRLTIAYWFPPSKRHVNRDFKDPNQKTWGVDPDDDLKVELSDAQREKVFTRMFLRDTGNLAADDVINTDSSIAERDDTAGDTKQPDDSDAKATANDVKKKQTNFDLASLGKPETIDRLLSADPSLKHDPQLLRALCWLEENHLQQ